LFHTIFHISHIHGFRLLPEWLGFIASTIKCVPVMPAEAGIHITDQHAVASEVSSDSDLDSGFRQNDGDSLKSGDY
jgi:hypothetical protein